MFDQPSTPSRRAFGLAALSALVLPGSGKANPAAGVDVAAVDRARILAAADRYLRDGPVTITAFRAERSTGGLHDYFSEGDYWWPDPAHPGGPYIRRDGFSNPANFVAHRDALIRLSVQAPALAAAWRLTARRRYADHALAHLRAWFVDPATRMNPNLEHAQAIFGRTPGRGIGVIDTVQLVEVARAAQVLEAGGALPAADARAIRAWFAAYLQWMTTSKNGLDERKQKNNHGSCWALQAAEFARLTGDEPLRAAMRERFRTVLVPTQVAPDGRQPLELARTKPYSYCLFNLDVLATLCQSLSGPGDDLWSFQTPDGRGVAAALAYMAPFIADKSRWPYPPDVEYFDKLPVRQPSLLFGGLALRRPDYVALWRRLDPDPTTPEIIRNFPVRQPILWL